MEQNTYNLKIGGFGGWDYFNQNVTEEHLNKRAKSGYSSSKESMVDPEKNRRNGINAKENKKGIFGLSQEEKTKNQRLATQRAAKLRKGRKDKIVECPHCKKTGGDRAMKRYHFDNCKNK